MTTSINSVNAGSSAASEVVAKKSQLSDSTKKELEALGITVTDDMSEYEAQQLIRTKAESNPQNNDGQGNSSEYEVLSSAKTLASALGISVADDAEVSDVLDEIGAEIEALLESAENNPSILSTVSGYLTQLTGLDEEYDNIVALRENYNNAMDMIATNKKLALGLQ